MIVWLADRFSFPVPNGIPGEIYAEPFNGTAMIVRWKPVEDTRQVIKGKLKGYKVWYCKHKGYKVWYCKLKGYKVWYCKLKGYTVWYFKLKGYKVRYCRQEL